MGGQNKSEAGGGLDRKQSLHKRLHPERSLTVAAPRRHPTPPPSCCSDMRGPIHVAQPPPVLEQVDLDPRHLRQLVVQPGELAQHPLRHRRRRLACMGRGSGGWAPRLLCVLKPAGQRGQPAGAPLGGSCAPLGCTAPTLARPSAAPRRPWLPPGGSNELTAEFMNVLSWAAWSLKTKAVGATMSTCRGGERAGRRWATWPWATWPCRHVQRLLACVAFRQPTGRQYFVLAAAEGQGRGISWPFCGYPLLAVRCLPSTTAVAPVRTPPGRTSLVDCLMPRCAPLAEVGSPAAAAATSGTRMVCSSCCLKKRIMSGKGGAEGECFLQLDS